MQSMLLSKALRMQQDLEDKKHEAIIENLESKIKEQSAIIEKKDFELQSTEGLLAETEAKVAELNSKLLCQSKQFEQEKLELDSKLEAEVQANSNLKKSLTSLQDKCLNFAKSCGYRPGALLFGGVDDEKLGCIRDQTGAKVIGTLSKSIGFPKLEIDISRYRRQHIVGSLFYSNFKVNILLSNFYCFLIMAIFFNEGCLFAEHASKQSFEDAARSRR